MKQIESLKENFEFRRVYKRGKSSADGYLAVYLFKNYNQKTYSRLGITVSNKIGKAVVRNKIRRRIKCAFHKVQTKVKPGFDIVVVSRTKSSDADFQKLEKSLIHNLKKIGVLMDE